MQHNYEVVPDILTGKDVDYLTDMFNWNYGALKKTNSYLSIISNLDVKARLEEAVCMFKENLNKILNILKEESRE